MKSNSIDLFEKWETLPSNVNQIIADFDSLEKSYTKCAKLVKDLNAVGYTCEYGTCPNNIQFLLPLSQS